jgi:hypothetical protein
VQLAEWMMITFREGHEWVVVLAEAGTHFDFALTLRGRNLDSRFRGNDAAGHD